MTSFIEILKNLYFCSKKSLQQFGWLWAAVLTGIVLLRLIKFGILAKPLAITAAAFLIISLLCPGVFRPLYVLWMGFGLVMSIVMTRVVLTIMFYLILTPIALLVRGLGKNDFPLHPTGDPSYWKKPDAHPSNRFEKQF